MSEKLNIKELITKLNELQDKTNFLNSKDIPELVRCLNNTFHEVNLCMLKEGNFSYLDNYFNGLLDLYSVPHHRDFFKNLKSYCIRESRIYFDFNKPKECDRGYLSSLTIDFYECTVCIEVYNLEESVDLRMNKDDIKNTILRSDPPSELNLIKNYDYEMYEFLISTIGLLL